MKDYTKIKAKIRITSGKEEELEELLQDTELMALVEKMCKSNNASIPLYIQFLMEQKAPGNPRLHELAEQVIAHAKKARPWIFL